MKKEIRKEIDGLKIRVRVEREVSKDVAYADGWNVELGKGIYEGLTVWIEKGDKKEFCRNENFIYCKDDPNFDSTFEKYPQVYGRFGDTYVSEPIYKAIVAAIAECKAAADSETSEEFVEIKKAKEEKKKAAIAELTRISEAEDSKKKHVGWCEKCGSYCYGDCTASEEV